MCKASVFDGIKSVASSMFHNEIYSKHSKPTIWAQPINSK